MKRAIALLAWNRPDYQLQVFESVKNAAREGWDVHIFIDGLLSVDRSVLAEESIDKWRQAVCIAKDCFPDASISVNSTNLGCSVQWTGVMSTMFDTLGYEEVCFIEDDLVVTPDYFLNCEHLSDVFKGRDDVGLWSCFGQSENPIHDSNTQ